MTEPRTTFAALRQFLLDLGFAEKVIPGSQVVFLHAASDTVIILPVYKSKQIVHPRHVASVRVMLDAKNLMSSDTFDRLMAADAVKQSAS
jgi:hypothetical protein